jgi:N-acyl-D-aspartate/D-glutamate deacylase
MPEFGGMRRMVNRNDAAVSATVVSGEVVYEHGEFADGYGRTMRTGRFLRAGEPAGTVSPVQRGVGDPALGTMELQVAP